MFFKPVFTGFFVVKLVPKRIIEIFEPFIEAKVKIFVKEFVVAVIKAI